MSLILFLLRYSEVSSEEHYWDATSNNAILTLRLRELDSLDEFGNDKVGILDKGVRKANDLLLYKTSKHRIFRLQTTQSVLNKE